MSRHIPLVFVLLVTPVTAAPPPESSLSAEQDAEFNELWDKSYRSFEARGRFYCRLAQQPDAAIEYITRAVKPATLTKKEAKELIVALGSNEEATWKQAYRDLRVRDVRLAMTFDDAWALAETEEIKLRLGHLLTGFGNYEGEAKSFELQPPRRTGGPKQLFLTNKNPHYANGVCDAWQTFEEWMASYKEMYREPDPRIVVTTSVLVRIGTKPARTHLRTLSNDGHAKAWTTTEATDALDRLTEPKPESVPMSDLWIEPFPKFPSVATVNQFLDRPNDTVKFLKENLRPVKPTADGVKKSLTRLFSDDLDEMRAALRELDLIDLRLVMTMEDAWKEAKTATQRCRLVATMLAWQQQPKRVISDTYDPEGRDWPYDYKYTEDKRFGEWGFEMVWRENTPLEVRKRKSSPGGGYTISNTAAGIPRDRWFRENTAIAILDVIGTDDAISVIKDMATGHPDAGPTKAAKNVLKRRGLK